MARKPRIEYAGAVYHLLLETPEPNRVAGMKWLQETCAQRWSSDPLYLRPSSRPARIKPKRTVPVI